MTRHGFGSHREMTWMPAAGEAAPHRGEPRQETTDAARSPDLAASRRHGFPPAPAASLRPLEQMRSYRTLSRKLRVRCRCGASITADAVPASTTTPPSMNTT